MKIKSHWDVNPKLSGGAKTEAPPRAGWTTSEKEKLLEMYRSWKEYERTINSVRLIQDSAQANFYVNGEIQAKKISGILSNLPKAI